MQRIERFVVNLFGTTVSEFAPGSTPPTATLTGLNYPRAMAFEASNGWFTGDAFGLSYRETHVGERAFVF